MSHAIPSEAGSFAPYCQRSVAKAPSLVDRALPRSRFGRSIFTTPLLLILRLFYQATSFDNYPVQPAITAPRSNIWTLCRKASAALDGRDSTDRVGLLASSRMDCATNLASKISTGAWHSLLQYKYYPIRPTSTLQSMTWVKSLSAPLSHEYLQFVVACNESRKRYRLIAERDTDGDWAYFIASSSDCESSAPLNKITQLRPYDYQHDLPLPLLSLSWSQLPYEDRPTIAQLANVLAQTSQLCPEYNVMREHCWW